MRKITDEELQEANSKIQNILEDIECKSSIVMFSVDFDEDTSRAAGFINGSKERLASLFLALHDQIPEEVKELAAERGSPIYTNPSKDYKTASNYFRGKRKKE